LEPVCDCGGETNAGQEVGGLLIVASCDAAPILEPIEGLLAGAGIDTTAFQALFAGHRRVDQYNTQVVDNYAEIAGAAERLRIAVKAKIAAAKVDNEQGIRTADSPLLISRQTLTDPSLINRAVSKEDTFRVETHLTTLRLRLSTRLDDRRWRAFLNYEDAATKIRDVAGWFELFGLGCKTGPKVSILDLSMLSNEVLPYACSVTGRISHESPHF
jgi:uncharacterized protein